ncbi:hypothetical protein F0562_008789 [Nyssa sinensis]|uniref:Uncharacterized protein n=1 Tax=Nyssa sinensis TaxID=561372 RepID=A0A5J5AAR1_9ASTE|nr:hypothetical protein F0562_008789 [Nyssa sinensis]
MVHNHCAGLYGQRLTRIHWRVCPLECPRIIVNPKPSPFGYRGIEVPREALPNEALDDPVVKDMDPKTWAVSGLTSRATSMSASSSNELPMAEKFRLAFVERDTRLAPKRAKNARQHQRRAEREWVLLICCWVSSFCGLYKFFKNSPSLNPPLQTISIFRCPFQIDRKAVDFEAFNPEKRAIINGGQLWVLQSG